MLALATAVWPLLVATIALMVSTASLAAIIVLWRRSRANVAVSWESALPIYRDGGVGPRHLAVSATNSGDRATTLVAWGLAIDSSGETLVDMHPEPWVPEMPYRLGPQDRVTWHVPLSSIATALCNAGQPHASLHAFVCLVNGNRVTASTPIKPAAFSGQPIVEPSIDLRTGRSASTMTAHDAKPQR